MKREVGIIGIKRLLTFVSTIETHYVVIPTKKLLEKVNKTRISPKGICRFSFYLDGSKLWEYWKPYLKPAYTENGVSYGKYHNKIKSIINF